MHLGDHVLAVDVDDRSLGSAEGDVQNGAILGDVDLVAAEHRIDPAAQVRLGGESEEQLHGFVDDAVLRVIGEEADGFESEPFAASGILGEEFA